MGSKVPNITNSATLTPLTKLIVCTAQLDGLIKGANSICVKITTITVMKGPH